MSGRIPTLPAGSQVPYQRIGGASSNIATATGVGSNTSIAMVPGGWFGGWLGVIPYWQFIGGGVTTQARWDAAFWDTVSWS